MSSEGAGQGRGTSRVNLFFLGLSPREQLLKGLGHWMLSFPLCVPAGSASPCTRPLPPHSISEVSITL